MSLLDADSAMDVVGLLDADIDFSIGSSIVNDPSAKFFVCDPSGSGFKLESVHSEADVELTKDLIISYGIELIYIYIFIYFFIYI